MNQLLGFINQISGYLWGYILIALLILLGLFFTFGAKFVQFTSFGDMIKLMSGKLPATKDGEKEDKSEVSSFQAFCISVASHVGTGNLAGVAIAVTLGGPGALFWMWVIALLGGATSVIENTLAQVYKVKYGEGFRGGPAYYIEKALGMKGLGIFFSVLTILTFAFAFNGIQAHTIVSAFKGSFPDVDIRIWAGIIATFTGIIIFGGITRIAKVSGLIVPVMSIAYVLVAIFVLVTNITAIPKMFMMIIESAFGMRQFASGAIAVTMIQGIKRGLYSNEAGMGSAPNAAATSNVSHPVKQALMQSFGVFIDTILICSATGFIVLLLPNYQEAGVKGIELTQVAISHSVGPWGAHFITLCLFLFAFSSVLGNYYYGEANIDFLTKDKMTMTIFRALVVITVYVASVADLGTVWDIGDLFMGLMAVINIIVILILSPKAFAVVADYKKQRAAGKNPVFKASDVGIDNTECWD